MRAVLANFIFSGVGRGAALLFRVCLIAIIGVSHYGAFSVVYSMVVFLTGVSGLSAASVIPSLKAGSENLYKHPELHCTYAVLQGVLSMVCVPVFVAIILTSNVGRAIGFRDLSYIRQFLFLTMLYMTCVGGGLLQLAIGEKCSKLQFRWAGMIESSDSVAKFAGTLILVLGLGLKDPSDVVFAYFAFSCILTFAYIFWVGRLGYVGGVTIRSALSLSNLKLILKIGGGYLAITMLTTIYWYSVRDQTYAVSPVLATIYDLFLTLYAVPKMVFGSLVRAMLPSITSFSMKKFVKPITCVYGVAMCLLLPYFVEPKLHIHDLLISGVPVPARDILLASATLLFLMPLDLLFGLLSSKALALGRSNRVVIGVLVGTLCAFSLLKLLAIASLAAMVSMYFIPYVIGLAFLWLCRPGVFVLKRNKPGEPSKKERTLRV